MQFEHFDNKIRQAAEQHHPNYDEKAWAKMEKLLDRHLPNKERKRRIILFLILFLLLGGGIWMIAEKPWHQKNFVSGVEKNAPENRVVKSQAGSTREEIEQPSPMTNGGNEPENELANQQGSQVPPGKDRNIPVNIGLARSVDKMVSAGQKDRLENGVNQKPRRHVTETRNDKPGDRLPADRDKAPDKLVREKDKEPVAPEQDKTKEPGETQAANAVTIPVKNEQAEKSQAVTKENEKAQSPASDQKAGKKINKRTNSLFLSASAGPDVSAVGLQYFGKLKLVGGLGLGYTFRDRWTIRSGFYSASKVYTADKEEYKPDVPPANYPYLNAIDANCRVYEIPLSLSYNFGRSIKNSWFASTGLSSYIMKKEAYVYNYKYPNGSTYTYNKTLINENKHYFSVLDLSGGFQHQFSKTFSLTAEPYVKIPLAGVGFGNVKLNSAGVLFSLNMNLANFSSSK